MRLLVALSLCLAGCGDEPASSNATPTEPTDTSVAPDTCEGPCSSDASAEDSLAAETETSVDASTPEIDLHPWKLTLPLANPDTGWAMEVKVPELLTFSSPPWFERIVDGGEPALRFRVPVDGVKTSSKTKFARSELREMTTSRATARRAGA